MNDRDLYRDVNAPENAQEFINYLKYAQKYYTKTPAYIDQASIRYIANQLLVTQDTRVFEIGMTTMRDMLRHKKSTIGLKDCVCELMSVARGDNDYQVTASSPFHLKDLIYDVPRQCRYITRSNALNLVRVVLQETAQSWSEDLGKELGFIANQDPSALVRSNAAYALYDMNKMEIAYDASKDQKATDPRTPSEAAQYSLRRPLLKP